MSRVFTAVGVAVVAVTLAGCAAAGSGGSGSTSTGSPAGSTLVATSTAAAAGQPTEQSSPGPTSTDGWYDTWGWVSPQTAERALAAGVAAGNDVRDELRCGVACGESPTAAEIQAQFVLEHPDNPNATLEAYEAAAAACPGYFIRANCYADAEAARAAGEGE